MKHKKPLKRWWVLGFIGLMLITRGWFVGLVLLTLAVYKIIKYFNEPQRKLDQIMEQDAANSRCTLPEDLVTRSVIEKIYLKYQQTCTSFPELRYEYDELLTSMWMKLSASRDTYELRSTAKYVLNNWPVPADESSKILESSMERTQKAANRMRRAQAEAHRIMV